MKSTIGKIAFVTQGKGKRKVLWLPEDILALPSMDLLELMLDEDDDYQPNYPWKRCDYLDEEDLSSLT